MIIAMVSIKQLIATPQEEEMATASTGYQCEFVDVVPDICVCKKCSLVARRLTVTSCCGESFCHDCISESKENNKPCPECGEEGFSFFDQKKFERQISNLQTFCNLKERGCGWSGPLKQLESHLDPDQDNCQYVDTKCPLNCPMIIPKNKVDTHVTKECVRRDFTCQHCNFKATYKEVVGTHYAECSYVPLQCPNRCGVTCERDVIKDHMKICRLQEVECEFSGVGCEERPKREDQEEHTRQSTQKHIALTATATIKSREMMEKKYEELETGMQTLQEKYEKQLQIQQSLCVQLEEKDEQLQQLKDIVYTLTSWQKQTEESLEELKHSILESRLSNMNFKIENFKDKVKQRSRMYSPYMQTTNNGYEFVACLDFSMNFKNGEQGVIVQFDATRASCNAELMKHPKNMEFTYEILDHRGNKLWEEELAILVVLVVRIHTLYTIQFTVLMVLFQCLRSSLMRVRYTLI